MESKEKSNLPKIDLDELEKEKALIMKERIDFHKSYAEWVKKTPNKKWSSKQKRMLG